MALDIAHSQRKLLELPTESILPNPNQPRLTFDEESLGELAQSISQVGLIQPLVVRKSSGGYELVAGERRLRACKSLGMTTVTCIVEEQLREESSAMMALIENLQREDLHYIEEAQCYYALLNNYNLTQEALARISGISLRMIRAYEQKSQDISKASFATVSRLESVLHAKLGEC